VLIKSDGFPTYHLAVVVDDSLMKITHVLRGEEWLSSLPKQILIARGLGIALPHYTHLPLILGTDRQKLSKRNGDASVAQYLQQGFVPEALLNYLAFLGWNPKSTQEIFSLDELCQVFDIAYINKASAIFDREKLAWMNQQYLSRMPVHELASMIFAYCKAYEPEFYHDNLQNAKTEYVNKVVSELRSRLCTLAEFRDLTTFFFATPVVDISMLFNAKMGVENLIQAKQALDFATEALQNMDEEVFETSDGIKEIIMERIANAGHKNGFVLWPLRVALSGALQSPGAFELASILGKAETIRRVNSVVDMLGKE
jgi:glutamyl-tRNA synthetase